MSQSQLPLWVQYAQALGAPLLAVVIGGFGAWIGFQQMRLARIKVQHDTYDRKYAVFQAVRWVLIVVSGLKRAPTLEDMRNFINEMAAVPFLFDNRLVEYLNEIETHVSRANGLHDIVITNDVLTAEDKAKASRELEDHISWLSEQSSVITEKFRPALELRKQRFRISWPLRRSRQAVKAV
jgi:hypothetical protein